MVQAGILPRVRSINIEHENIRLNNTNLLKYRCILHVCRNLSQRLRSLCDIAGILRRVIEVLKLIVKTSY